MFCLEKDKKGLDTKLGNKFGWELVLTVALNRLPNYLRIKQNIPEVIQNDLFYMFVLSKTLYETEYRNPFVFR